MPNKPKKTGTKKTDLSSYGKQGPKVPVKKSRITAFEGLQNEEGRRDSERPSLNKLNVNPRKTSYPNSTTVEVPKKIKNSSYKRVSEDNERWKRNQEWEDKNKTYKGTMFDKKPTTTKSTTNKKKKK
jgi:hypothetical protein